MKAIIYLTPASLVSNGPRIDHPGASGAAYPYLWSPAHGRHILYGREIDAAELDKVAPEIFGAEKAFRIPIPQLVPEPAAPSLDETPPATVESVFEQCAKTLPPADQRKLGFKLVNATRPPRTGRKKKQADKKKGPK